MRFLNTQEYDNVLRAALAQHGLSTADARRLIACRWPMGSDSLPAEAVGRGLIIDSADWCAYVAEFAPDAEGDFVGILNAEAAEEFFQWCADTGRARLTEVGRHLQRDDADKVIRQTCRRSAAANN